MKSKTTLILLLLLCLFFPFSALGEIEQQPTVHQLVENFLSDYPFGAGKEKIIWQIKDEPVSTLVNDTATFYRFVLIDGSLSIQGDNEYSVVPIKITLEFEEETLVWKQLEWIGEFKGSEAVRRFSNVIAGVSTETFGGPIIISEEEKEIQDANILRTSWSNEDISSDLFICDIEDALFYRVYNRRLLKNIANPKSIAIDKLRFGIIDQRTEDRISYVKETRRIPLGGALFHGLDFKILPKQATVRLEIVRPGDFEISIGRVAAPETHKILNYGSKQNNFSAVFDQSEADRLGKYQIKIYIDRVLSGMVAFEVVPNN